MTRGRFAAARVDADASIGLGHLKRCVTLLKRLRCDGFEVSLITRRPLSGDVLAMTDGIPILSLEQTAPRNRDGEVDDAEATLAVLGKTARSWMVVDHYGLGESWERRVRAAGHCVLVIDDYRHRRHSADIVLSEGTSPFDPALIDAARVLTGHEYALIDESFTPVQRSTSGPAKRVLISYGGADSTGETRKAIDAIAQVRSRRVAGARLGRVDVVIGPVNAGRAAIERHGRDAIGAEVHFSPVSLAPLLKEADLVLTAGGNSVVEALVMKRPCLVTVVADNQRTLAAELTAANAITLVGDHASVSPAMLAEAIERALADYDRLARRAAEQEMFDHLGAARVSRVMQEAIL